MSAPLKVVHVNKNDPEVRGGLPLTPAERQFCEEYFAGDFAYNATRAYMATFPDVSYALASVEGSRLLKSDRVRSYLRDLHERITAETASSLREWSELLPLAQSVIEATAQSRLKNRLSFDAACYITNRCLGSPTAISEIHVKDSERIRQGVAAFSARLADAKRKQKRLNP
jgi:hypothetical protein